jgi:hypothetical protein
MIQAKYETMMSNVNGYPGAGTKSTTPVSSAARHRSGSADLRSILNETKVGAWRRSSLPKTNTLFSITEKES